MKKNSVHEGKSYKECKSTLRIFFGDISALFASNCTCNCMQVLPKEWAEYRTMNFSSENKNLQCKMKRAKSTPKAKSAPISRGPIWNMLGRFGQKESKQF